MKSRRAHIEVENYDVVVTGASELHSRHGRRFFQAVLGGRPFDDGWRIPRRGARIQDFVVRINSFLEGEGFQISRGVLAAKSVKLALERRRSLERAGSEARSWKAGHSTIDDQRIAAQLEDLGWKPERRLHPHQLRNVCHALAAVNQANFSVPGAGKTVTAVATGLLHFNVGTIDALLVVGPLACFEPWESEAAAAVGPLFRPIRVRGSARLRRESYADAARGDLLLMSYAMAASDRLALMEMCERLSVMLIVDESHRIKRFSGGVWAPALTEIAELARVRMILTGTPMPKSPRDLFSQINVLWPNGLLTGSRSEFAGRVNRSPAVVRSMIEPFTTRTAKSELGLPPYRIQRHRVPMTGTQADIYQLIRNRLRNQLDDADTWEDKLNALRRGRPIRLLQAASNPDLLNHPDDAFRLSRVPPTNPTLMERLMRFAATDRPAKSDAALRIAIGLMEERKKVVCWSNFIRNLDSFSDLLRRELGIPVFQVDGRVPASDDPLQDRRDGEVLEDDTRERRIEQFLSVDGPAALVTNPATSSESISLHRACHDAIYLDRTYDAALFFQSIDRIHRLGLPEDADVTIHILQATVGDDDTIDHLVDASLLNKQEAMEELLGGAEIHPLYQDAADAEGSRADLEQLIRYLVGEEVDGEL